MSAWLEVTRTMSGSQLHGAIKGIVCYVYITSTTKGGGTLYHNRARYDNKQETSEPFLNRSYIIPDEQLLSSILDVPWGSQIWSVNLCLASEEAGYVDFFYYACTCGLPVFKHGHHHNYYPFSVV